MVATYLLFLFAFTALVDAGSKSKPHHHKGILPVFSGDHIPYNITSDQNLKLKSGEPVTINQRSGKSGGTIVLQDIHAPPNLCMDRIRDLGYYHKVVPSVKSIVTYNETKYEHGTVRTGAQFNVGISILTFSYFVVLTFKPELNTLTWTLDYQYSSDFDDNVGHWQVMPHPIKDGWSRVLYSCKVKVPNWIPEFVVGFLMKTAAIEATTWVKTDSERVFKLNQTYSVYPGVVEPNLKPCYKEFPDGSAEYESSCAAADAAVGTDNSREIDSPQSYSVSQSGDATLIPSMQEDPSDIEDDGSSPTSPPVVKPNSVSTGESIESTDDVESPTPSPSVQEPTTEVAGPPEVRQPCGNKPCQANCQCPSPNSEADSPVVESPTSPSVLQPNSEVPSDALPTVKNWCGALPCTPSCCCPSLPLAKCNNDVESPTPSPSVEQPTTVEEEPSPKFLPSCGSKPCTKDCTCPTPTSEEDL